MLREIFHKVDEAARMTTPGPFFVVPRRAPQLGKAEGVIGATARPEADIRGELLIDKSGEICYFLYSPQSRFHTNPVRSPKSITQHLS